MEESDQNLPARREDRIDTLFQVVGALSDFERDQLRLKLNDDYLRDYHRRLHQWRHSLAVSSQILVFGATIFGLTMGLAAGTLAASKGGLMAALAAFAGTAISTGPIFGGAMAAFFLTITRIVLPRLHKSPANLAVIRAGIEVQELQLPLSADEAFTVCHTSISAERGARLETADRKNGAIGATTAISWRSPGEFVGVKIDPLSSDLSRVRVYSRSIFNSASFGKNRLNVIHLAKAIEDNANVHALLKDG